jgi:hypothetical protein
MPSDLQVSNLKDLTGSNTGLTIASDGQITVNQNNPTITLGSNATFPNKNFFIAAYVVFDGTSDTGSGTSQTILDSLNVTSVVRSGSSTGIFIVNLSITMANSNYVIIGSADGNGSEGSIAQYDSASSTRGTTSFGIRTYSKGSTFKNVNYSNIIVIGDR